MQKVAHQIWTVLHQLHGLGRVLRGLKQCNLADVVPEMNQFASATCPWMHSDTVNDGMSNTTAEPSIYPSA